MDELLNSVNTQEAADPVIAVETESGAESAPTAELTADGMPETQPGPAPEQPKQTKEDNSKFAAMRRELEAAQSRARELEKGSGAIKEALKLYGIEGTSEEEIHDQLVANARKITPEQAKAERIETEQRIKDALKSDPEYLSAKAAEQQYKDMMVQEMMKNDLTAIKTAHPEATINSVGELGAEFSKLIGAGFNAVDAYEFIQLRENKTKVTPPPSTGTVKSTETAKEKDYFTPAEVDKFTDADFKKNPKLVDKIIASMPRWGR